MADYDLTNSCADINAVLVASDHMLQYVCDPSEADQGVAGNGNSLKDLIDDIGTSKQATIYLLHHAADGNTTTYTVTTAESVPDNIKLNISEGAIIGGAGTLTFDSPGQIISGYKQELFGSSVDIKFTIAGLVYVQWWNGSAGDGSTECATAVQAAVDSVVSHSATALKVMFPPGDYVISSEIATEKNIWIAGEGESSYLDFSSLGVALSAFEFDSAGNPLDDFKISGLKVVGPGGDWDDGGCGVRVNSSHHERIIVENMRIEKFSHGIRLDGQTTGESPWIVNNWLEKNSYSGIYLIDTQDAYIAGNHINSLRTGVGDEVIGRVGIWETIESGGDGNLNNRIIGNIVKNTSVESILVRGKHTVVSSNTISDGARGISVEPFSNDTPTEEDGELHVSVIGNTVTTMTGYAICLGTDVGNITQGVSNCVVSSNTITDCGTTWSMAVGGSTETPEGKNNLLIGNIISDGYGGIFAQKTENLQLIGNVISDVDTYGIRLNAVNGANVVGGSVNTTGADPGDGVAVVGGTNIRINGVDVLDVDRYGVTLGTSADDIVVSNCRIYDEKGVPTMVRGINSNSTITNFVHFNNSFKGYSGVAVENEEAKADGALPVWGASELSGADEQLSMTLADGEEIGAIKTIVLSNASNQPHTVSVTHHVTSDPEVGTFDAVDETWVLIWTGTEWATIYATCTF